jgi:hypothetical protein
MARFFPHASTSALLDVACKQNSCRGCGQKSSPTRTGFHGSCVVRQAASARDRGCRAGCAPFYIALNATSRPSAAPPATRTLQSLPGEVANIADAATCDADCGIRTSCDTEFRTRGWRALGTAGFGVPFALNAARGIEKCNDCGPGDDFDHGSVGRAGVRQRVRQITICDLFASSCATPTTHPRSLIALAYEF